MIEAGEVTGRWIELPGRAVLRFSGPDRVRYLNGQVTNSLDDSLDREAKPACVCSLKGKVEALVWISARDGSLLVDGQVEQRDELVARLDRYLIADDCELHDETGEWRLVHHFDDSAGGVACRRLAVPGYDLWLRAGEELPDFPGEAFAPGEFRFLQLRSLVPEFPHEITGEEFPAELGLDRWAVDFHKGCYLGQEVVSRIESVGRVKRRLVLTVAESPVSRLAGLRIGSGEGGIATRDFVAGPEKRFYGCGLFKDLRDPSRERVQPDAFQRVTVTEEGPDLI